MAKDASFKGRLEADESVGAQWLKIRRYLQSLSVLGESSPGLSEYALGNFQPKLVIERLLSANPTYFGQKQILFAGLSAYTISPNNNSLIDEAMIQAGILSLAELEESRRSEFSQDTLLADYVTRIAGPGIDFYEDFYFPMGGTRRILDARSPPDHAVVMSKASEQVGFALEVMRVCHYHASHLQDRSKYRPASLKSAGDAISSMLSRSNETGKNVNYRLNAYTQGKGMTSLNCIKKASAYKKSFALLYAAANVIVCEKSLLDAICESRAAYEVHGNSLHEWIGKSSFVAKRVIDPMFKRESKDQQMDFLVDFPEKSFAVNLSEDAAEAIKKAFSIRR